MIFFKKNENEDEDEWLPISDLMSGLMTIFILITISYIYVLIEERIKLEESKKEILRKELELKKAQEEIRKKESALKKAQLQIFKTKKKMKQVKVTIEKVSKSLKDIGALLNEYLNKEFKKDLKKWNAEILTDNTVRFKSPQVLFAVGKSDLKWRFKAILNDFFPRYLKIISKFQKYNFISEVRIEGHTSSRWNRYIKGKEAYIKNAELSQKRAFAVLKYILQNTDGKYFSWLQKLLRANGLSSSKPILRNGKEDFKASRRVDFRVITNLEDSLEKMQKAVKELDSLNLDSIDYE